MKVSRESVNFSVTKKTDNTLIVNFDFLDFNDGAIIGIQHDGNEETKVLIPGVILGAPEGVMFSKPSRFANSFRLPKFSARFLDYSSEIEHPLKFKRIGFTQKAILSSLSLLLWLLINIPLLKIVQLGTLQEAPLSSTFTFGTIPFSLEFAMTPSGMELVEINYNPLQTIAFFTFLLLLLLFSWMVIWIRPVPFPSSLDFEGNERVDPSSTN